MSTQNTTPLMKQYWDIKSLHPDKVLMFRMGDFFEMFFDDAVTAAPILGIALTSRNKKSGDETPMCGMPHHSVAGPINKLLAAGHKVAICDQIEDPKFAKGLVKRAITRILTPGMVYDLETLESGRSNYLMSFDDSALSFVDTSTGEAFWLAATEDREIRRLLELLPIAEVVLSEDDRDRWARWGKNLPLSFHADLMAADHPLLPGAPMSSRRLLSYVQSMGGGEILRTLSRFVERTPHGRLHLHPNVVRHLELFESSRGQENGSLFHAVDRTKTAAGRRLLRQWLSFPLQDIGEIETRQRRLESWRSRPADMKRLREILSGQGDLERRLGKIPLPTCNARDLLALRDSLDAGMNACRASGEPFPGEEPIDRLCRRLDHTLVDDPPLSTKQGHLIRRGVRADLDEVIELSTDAQAWLSKMEERERRETGIPSLKIRYNNVFGYYIEITNSHRDKAPARYQRKQTLANAERYCTDELLDLERKVLSAQTRRSEMESEVFEELRREILAHADLIVDLARRSSELDVVAALAWLALEKNYTRPRLSPAPARLRLLASRHPVVEQSVKAAFVPNDIELDAASGLLLTGPNMAGKSTLMRQTALIAILAQIGSFVPAADAELPVFDAIYTRIGANDQLSEGLSTFMVEMTETAALLSEATRKSLVVLDEIGRGTSTYDGLCLAQSILEHLLSNVRCLTLFATHYHELTRLESVWPQLINAHMTVADRQGDLRFLHTLARGPAMKSYGVQVAELAGLPPSVTKRARGLLRELEAAKGSSGSQLALGDWTAPASSDLIEPLGAVVTKPSPQDEALKALIHEIRQASLPQMTPIDAMNRLAQWQERCRELS